MPDWEAIFREKGRVFTDIQEDMPAIVRYFKEKEVRKVLDLGCGTGRHTVYLAREGFSVYGTDIALSGIDHTRSWLNKEGLDARLVCTSRYEEFPFDDNTFDAVISTQVIHHNEHDLVRFCIDEIYRVLKPGGFLFLTVAAKKAKGDSRKSRMVAKNTFVPLEGDEAGLPHFIYPKKLLLRDLSHFRILSYHRDSGSHHCILAKKI